MHPSPGPHPFDPELAESHATRLPIAAVVDLLGRCPHDETRVETYRAAMLAGGRFPPIAVVRLGPWYLVADGHKRLSAYLRLIDATPGQIDVEVWSWRRWMRDQIGQARNHAQKNGRMLQLCLTDPAGARRLLQSTFGHWQRVARSLAGLARRTAVR